MAPAPLVRLSLHPADARFPALVRHAQRLVERLLADRRPLTKAGFAGEYAERLTSTDPTGHRRPNESGHNPHTGG
jgi:hypothetical protein